MGKILKYQNLVTEIGRMSKMKARVMPIVIGDLGTVYWPTDWLFVLGIGKKQYNTIQQRIWTDDKLSLPAKADKKRKISVIEILMIRMMRHRWPLSTKANLEEH